MAPHTAYAENTTVSMTTAIAGTATIRDTEVIPYVIHVGFRQGIGFRFEDEHSRLWLCVVIVIVVAYAIRENAAFHYCKHSLYILC